MMLTLLVLLGVGLKVMTPKERKRLLNVLIGIIRLIKEGLVEARVANRPFLAQLRERNRLAIVAPTIIVFCASTYVLENSGGALLNDPKTLIAWGANFGPRTTNGEWWRLV